MSLIRKATIDDMPYILELLYELDRPKPIDDKEVEIFKEKIQNYFSDTQKSLFVVEQESKIVGLVSILFLQRQSCTTGNVHTRIDSYYTKEIHRNRKTIDDLLY